MLFVTALLFGAAPRLAPVFSVQEKAGVWSFVAPDRKRFWSLGVDCTGTGTDAKTYDPKNPSYASYRLFADDKEWTQKTLADLRSWGFNSLGGWSDTELFQKYGGAARLPYFTVLHLGAYNKAPWNDMFSAENAKIVDKAARDQILKLRDDPYLVGYSSDNELGWWDDTLFLAYLKMKPSEPGHQKVIETLARFYKSNFKRFQKDWITDARDFKSIEKLKLRPGGTGRLALKEFIRVLAGQYYRLMQTTIRRYDSKRLILGDRYCQYYTLPVVEASAPYIDVASTNFGADWNDGSISKFFLDTLGSLTKKPVVITEFYMGAKENRSRSRNSGSAFPLVDTQVQRARSYDHYLRSLAALPQVVGAHWFQFYDEPPLGRGDGEDWNMGIVDTLGRPYEQMVKATQSLNLPALRRVAKDRPAHRDFVVPAACAKPFESLKLWPRDAGFVTPSSGVPFADLYASRDSSNLYLGLFAQDYADESLYVGNKMPEGERSFWTFSLSGKSFVVRFAGDKRKPTCSDSRVKLSVLPGLKYTVIASVPLALVPRGPIRLVASTSTHSRAETMGWRGMLRLVRN